MKFIYADGIINMCTNFFKANCYFGKTAGLFCCVYYVLKKRNSNCCSKGREL